MWAIFDNGRQVPAEIGETPMIGLTFNEAAAITNLLNFRLKGLPLFPVNQNRRRYL